MRRGGRRSGFTGTPAQNGFSFPPEWAPHSGTWISWPRPEGISFPGRYQECINDVVHRYLVDLQVPADETTC